MPHSNALEAHVREKMGKIKTLFKHSQVDHPFFAELFLNAQTAHTSHHTVELRIKTSQFHLTTHDQGTDMYTVCDRTIDKMVSVLKKEKAKAGDKKHRVQTEKTAFAS
jgi:ribosomal subunit interface protein